MELLWSNKEEYRDRIGSKISYLFVTNSASLTKYFGKDDEERVTSRACAYWEKITSSYIITCLAYTHISIKLNITNPLPRSTHVYYPLGWMPRSMHNIRI